MKPLLLYLNLAGPISHPEHGQVHQLEIGLQPKDGKAEASRIVIKTKSTLEAIDVSAKALKSIVEKYYPKQAGEPGNLIKLE